MAVFLATIRKNFMTLLRAYPVDFFVGSLLTAFYTNLGAWLLYVCLFNGKLSGAFREHAGTGDYLSYVIVGTVVYGFVVHTCLNVGRTLITELREGTLESVMLAPFHRQAYFGATMCLQTLTTMGETCFTVLIGAFFGLRFSQVNLGYLGVAVAVSLLGFYGLSMVLASVMLYTRDTYISQNTLFAIIFLVCGISFPIQYLPSGVQLVAALLPVTDAVAIIRGSLLGGMAPQQFWVTVGRLLAVSTVYLLVGFYSMPRVERIAIERMEG